jgi:hypothetical protein
MAVQCYMHGRRLVFYYGAELRDRHRGSSSQTRYHVARKIEEVQHTPYALTHHVVDALRMVIERLDGGHDDGAHPGGLFHQRDVTCMKWCFPQHQDEAAAFLEADVGGSDDEVFVVAVRDSAQTLDRTGNHDHALRPKGATGNGRADVFMVVHYIAELSQVLDGEVGFSQQRARGRGEMTRCTSTPPVARSTWSVLTP